MNELQIFNNDQFGNIRMVDVDGVIYFVASDVARALKYQNTTKAINDHCKGVTKRYIPTNGGKQRVNIIPEPDVFRLITHSKLPTAEKFEKWVFEEVLPTIRKTGGYSSIESKQIDDNKDYYSDVRCIPLIQNRITRTQKAMIALNVAFELYNRRNRRETRKAMEESIYTIAVSISGEITQMLRVADKINESTQ